MASWVSAERGEPVIRVRVQPRASHSRVCGVLGDRLKIAVHSPPEGGAANSELIRVLAKALRVPKGNMEILRGHRGREKDVRIASGLTCEDIIHRLEG